MLKLWAQMSKSAQPQGRFHNPKVGGSIPPPATNIRINSKTYNKLENRAHDELPKPSPSYHSKPSKILRFFTYLCAVLAVLGSTNPKVTLHNLASDCDSVCKFQRFSATNEGMKSRNGYVICVSATNKVKAITAKIARARLGRTRRQMNRSIMFSASKFSAHLGQPRAVCSSTLPQSRQVFALMGVGPLIVNIPKKRFVVCC